MLKYIIVVFVVLLGGCRANYVDQPNACSSYVITWLDAADKDEVASLRNFAVNKIVEPFDFVLSTNVSDVENDFLCASVVVPGKHFVITEYKP